MKIIQAKKRLSDRDIRDICASLASGGLIMYPTETCYGIGADATNTEAIEKLWQFKGGRGKKAVSILVDSKETAGRYVDINDTAAHLYDNFLPGPITVISKSKGKVVPKVESERGTLGVRIPDHPIPLQIAKSYGKPFTATSANTSGKPAPYSLYNWQKHTSHPKQVMIDYIIDADQLPYNEPSTVVDTTLGELDIVRPGKIDLGSARTHTHTSKSVKDTYRIAAQFVQNILLQELETKPVILALSGELGSGKTHFTQGLGVAFGISEQIVSPTYQVMREYDYDCGKLSGKVTKIGGKPRGKLIHIDTWRLHSPEEISDFAVDNYLKPNNLIVIEWPEKVDSWIQSQSNQASLHHLTFTGIGEEPRSIHMSS